MKNTAKPHPTLQAAPAVCTGAVGSAHRAAPRFHRRARLGRLVSSAACVAALVLGGCRRPADTDDTLVLSGNIEVVDAQLSFKIPGRVASRPVFEGDRVKAGQLIAQLDDVEQRQQLALRQAEVAAADAVLAELEAGSRPQEIASAEASVRSAEAERHRAEVDFRRQRELLKESAISARDHDTAEAQLKVAQARVAEASERLKLVREGPRPEAILQARARLEQARASVALAQTQLDYTRLVSPLEGVVLSHNIEPGEFVAPGTPVVTVADTVHVWVRAYIDQADLGRIKHGQRVPIRTDTFPDKRYEGVVGFIASEAEFTPKTVQTARERVKLVFRIKVNIDNPHGELKPGMPADVLLPR